MLFVIVVIASIIASGEHEIMISKKTWPTETECKSSLPGEMFQLKTDLEKEGVKVDIRAKCFPEDEARDMVRQLEHPGQEI